MCCANGQCTPGIVCGEDNRCAGPSGATASVYVAVSSLCAGIQGMLPVAAMLMIVLGAVIYAAGQTMGAETRARANVWATAALTGALMAILIVAVSQPILSALYPGIHC